MPARSGQDDAAAVQSTSRLYSLQLLSYGANALAKPYVNLYLVASGVTATTLGLLLSIGALVEMLLPPLLNTLADRHRQHRLLYMGFIAALALGSVLMASSDRFIVLAIAAVLIEGAFLPSMTLGLQLVITRMDWEGRLIVGRVRSFSSLGFGVAGLLASWLFMIGGYVSLFTGAALAYFASLTLVGSLPAATTRRKPAESVARVPRTRGFYLVAVSMFFLMMGHRTGSAFWLVHFQQNLGVSTSEIGIITAVMALVEIPFFLLLDRALRRYDLRIVFLSGGIGLGAFWFAVGILPGSVWIYPLLVFRGLVFAVFHLTTFLVISRVSNTANVATNQALAQGTIPSLTMLLTGSISGWIYEHLGAQTLFTLAMALCFAGMAVILLIFRQLRDPDAESPGRR